jgi:hypothetical protein
LPTEADRRALLPRVKPRGFRNAPRQAGALKARSSPRTPYRTRRWAAWALMIVTLALAAACAPPPDPQEPKRAALAKEMAAYWLEVQKAIPREPPELAMEIKTGDSFAQVADETSATLDHFEQMLKLVDAEGKGPNWEVLNLGVPNHLKTLRIELALLDLKRTEERLMCDPDDAAAHKRLDRAKEVLLKLATEARAAD